MQAQLGHVFEKEFYPKLELLLERYAVPDYTWDIDCLDIVLPSVNAKNWKAELVDTVLAEIEDYLKSHKPILRKVAAAQTEQQHFWLTDAEHAEHLLFDFLKTGMLTANSLSQELRKILGMIEVNPSFRQRLLVAMAANDKVLARWIFAIPVDFKTKIGQQLTATDQMLTRFFVQLFQNRPVAFIRTSKIINPEWLDLLQWFSLLYGQAVSKTQAVAEFLRLSNQYWEISLIEMRAVFAFADKQVQTESNRHPNELRLFLQEIAVAIYNVKTQIHVEMPDAEPPVKSEASHFINNAGLVILHPFLQMLFEKLGLCKEENWTTKNSQHKAVLLTQYLVSGHDEIFENELLFNKILCGLPFDGVVNTKLKITQNEKDKCQSLLETVNGYWKAMNGSSVAALRESFLLREGKISLENDPNFELWVAEKGFDILLEQLPWGISLFKTPWMKDFMNCYWD